MVSIALVVFREVFEIALIIGILMAATKGLPGRTRWVGLGLVLGALGAGLIAFFADGISQAAEGMGQELFNAGILLLAAVLIGWTTLWMTRHGRQVTQEFKEIGQELSSGSRPMYSLAFVVALAVLREGAEVVMFTYSAFLTGETIPHLVMGCVLGAGLGAMAGILLYFGLTKIPTGKIFHVISWLLVFLVAGMVVQAFGYLTAAGKVPELIPTLWDTSSFIARGSLIGQVLHALLGYTDRPSGIQLLVYGLTIAGLTVLLRTYGSGRGVTKCIICALIGAVCVLGGQPNACAEKHVYSPIVEKGEWELESTGTISADHRKEQSGVQEYKSAIGYGVTDRWATELYGEYEKQMGEDEGGDPKISRLKFSHLEWENRYQLAEQGALWADPGFYLAYEMPLLDKDPGKIETKILLEKNLSRFTHTANFIIDKEVGGGSRLLTEGGFAWSSRYRLSEHFQPGFEYYAGLGELRKHLPFKEQEHQAGPVIYGKCGHVKYDVGYLFGVSDAAPMREIKWVMEYEFRF
ncbi:MAG: FTR1 family protein [Candidatus Omnitrophota bacterium]